MARREIKKPEIIISEDTMEAWKYTPSKHGKRVVNAARKISGYKPNLRALEEMIDKEPSLEDEINWIKNKTEADDWTIDMPEFKPASELVFGPKAKKITTFNYLMDKQTDAYMNSRSLRNNYYSGYISTVKCKNCGNFLEAWPSCMQKDYEVNFPWCIICRYNRLADRNEGDDLGINKGLAFLEEQSDMIRNSLDKDIKKCKHLFDVVKKTDK